jgi:hypothetical protein
MQPTTTATANNPYYVYGITMNNEKEFLLTKKVMNIALAVFMISVISRFFSFFAVEVESIYSLIFGIGLASLVPMCGYFGAKNKDGFLLTWFWACNAVGCVFAFLALLPVFPFISLLARADCSQLEDSDARDQCLYAQAHLSAYIIYAVMTIVSMVLSFLSCTWGRQLKDQVEINSVLNAHAPVTVMMKQQPTNGVVVPVGSAVQMTAQPQPASHATTVQGSSMA